MHPQKGRKKKILELVKANAHTLFTNQVFQSNEQNRIQILTTLGKMIQVDINQLNRMEFLDLSYFDDQLTVAGFSHYLNGASLLKKNQIYQLENVEHNEKDYFKKAIIKHYTKHPLPGLLILDGGILQLQGAKEGLKKIQKETNIIALVKNKKHQTEYLLNSKGRRITLDLKSKIGLFLSRLQTEGHLYVIKNFQILLRKSKKELYNLLENKKG